MNRTGVVFVVPRPVLPLGRGLAAHRQLGGTILGLVLGVLVGLAVALGVAVYVTKVPVPFVDRVISRNAADDAAEAERNKGWDPNAALQGGKAKPAAGAPATANAPAVPDEAPARPELLPPPPPPKKAAAPSPAAGENSAKPSAAATDAPAAKGKTYSSSADPLGDLANQQAQGKTFGTSKPAASVGSTGAAAPAEAFAYFVQVGAYRTPEDAQAQRARLVLMGLDAAVSEREQSGRTVYRVRLGPYDRQADAEKMKGTLEPGGFEAALVRVQR